MFVKGDVEAAIMAANTLDTEEIDHLYRAIIDVCPKVQTYSRAKKTLEMYWHQASKAVKRWMLEHVEKLTEMLILHARSAAVTADVDHRDARLKVLPGKILNDYDEYLRLVKKADRAVGRANALRDLSQLDDAPRAVIAKRVKRSVSKLTKADIKKVIKHTSKPSRYSMPSLFLDDCWSE